MLANRQQVACITYTEIARQEIEDELAGNPTAHVSTIHSFLWTLVAPFQENIRRWLSKHGELDVAELQEEYDQLGPRVKEKRRVELQAKIARKSDQLAKLPAVEKFQLGVGTNYELGIVGYADIVELGPELVLNKPLLARLFARRYPVLFVDESQDTFDAVVACLRHVAVEESATFCLGFFGDPMQMIYTNGTGEIPMEHNWKQIPKPENFRSPLKVLNVINAIRGGQDDLQQESGLPIEQQRPGEVTYFVFPKGEGRNELLDRARLWLRGTRRSAPGVKRTGAEQIRHRHHSSDGRQSARLPRPARRVPRTKLANDFTEGTAWPLTPFLGTLLPLVEAASINRSALLPILRRSSPLLRRESLNAETAQKTLATLSAGVDELVEVMTHAGPASIRGALAAAQQYGLLELDDRLSAFLADDAPEPAGSLDEALMAYLDCDVTQLRGYSCYISQESPYSTQHGVKGAEYPDVIVVLDDDEGTHRQYSYDKLFGLTPSSSGDGTVTRTRACSTYAPHERPEPSRSSSMQPR